MNCEQVSKTRILRYARALIEDGSEEFVCHAIREVGDRLYMAITADTLISAIERALGPNYGTVSSWLIKQQGFTNDEIFFKEQRDVVGYPRLREYRLRWIDDMIRTIENGGDL